MAVYPIESQGAVKPVSEQVLFNSYEFVASLEEAKSFVHIYTIASKKFELSHPVIGKIHVPKCPTGERYYKVASIRHPYPQFTKDEDGKPVVHSLYADRIVMDMLSPDNRTLDQNAVITDSFSLGNNYNQQGLFWSKNNPPTEAELKDAEKRLETRYRNLLEAAVAIESQNPADLVNHINEDYRLAADYFGEEYSWHKKRAAKKPEAIKEECPNCGTEVRKGAAFHFDAESGICVIDWKRAYEAGKVKKADVPEGKEWWTAADTAKETLAALTAVKK
jgi:hypothetical protein